MDKNQLQNELDQKITEAFKSSDSYLNYLHQTMNNFVHRYLETTENQNPALQFSHNLFIAENFESNMGEALKISSPEIKNHVKNLAKSFTREQRPMLKLTLSALIHSLNENHGSIKIVSKINWDFPMYREADQFEKIKFISFNYNSPHEFRKELALKFEEVCDLFN